LGDVHSLEEGCVMTIETPTAFVPTASAISRALKRAETGVTIDATEAETLLHARGADLDRLLLAAGRMRDSGLEKAGRPGVIT
jgi:FO synthase